MMKDDKIEDTVERVVGDVFENMYFMFPETIEKDDMTVSVPDSCFKARVRVRNGSEVFILYASERLVKDMAKNLLGSQEAVKEGHLVDMFTEAANVIAGNLVTALALDASIGLDIPVAQRLTICSEAGTVPGTMFNIDGEYFKLAVMNRNG
jgi:hypothetical protein